VLHRCEGSKSAIYSYGVVPDPESRVLVLRCG